MKSADIEKEIDRLAKHFTKHYSNTKNPVNFPESNTFDDLLYHSGLTAQGCWDTMDDYDRAAILKFAELIVRECIDKITTYDLVPGHSAKWEDIYDIHTRLLDDLGEALKEHFGVE